MITVKLPSLLHKDTGVKEYQSSAKNVGAVLKELPEKYGTEFSRYTKHYAIFVNGTDCRQLKGKRTKLNPGDEVQLFLVIAGG